MKLSKTMVRTKNYVGMKGQEFSVASVKVTEASLERGQVTDTVPLGNQDKWDPKRGQNRDWNKRLRAGQSGSQ